MEQHALEVSRLLVVLQSPLHETRLLAELADEGLVIMREHVHLQDGLCHFRCLLQVHGQELSLKLGLVGPVGLECIEKDGSGFLQPVLLHEDFHHLVDVNEGCSARTLKQVLGKVCGPIGVDGEHVLQQNGVVGLVADLFHISNDLVVLPLLHEARDHLLVRIGSQVNGQGELGLHGPHNVAELFGALELVLLEPLLHQLTAPLLNDGPYELHRLQGVQLPILQERGEVVENGGGLSRGCLHRLELLDRIRRP
mmetsp:Transcript_49881/g.106886  ORF Transcript_49881/g.106886 Transcript_49881/m.106886 type:complete len:253 (-) Transcript_49881:1219-1977(-)